MNGSGSGSSNDAGSTGGDSTSASSSGGGGGGGGGGTIVEDDQQLYDWGIENRMDQYYQAGRSEPLSSIRVAIQLIKSVPQFTPQHALIQLIRSVCVLQFVHGFMPEVPISKDYLYGQVTILLQP